MDVAEWTRHGLYDPDAPDATERRELLEYLADHGATLEEMVAADREQRLPFVLGDKLISPGRPELTLDDVARQSRTDPEVLARCWRALGFVRPDDAAPAFAPADAEVLQLLAIAVDVFGEEAAIHLTRVIGSSMARIAEAGFTSSLANVEGSFLARAPHPIDSARAAEGLGLMSASAGRIFDVVFRRHVEVTARRWDRTPSEDPATVELAIGFADLVGFTSTSRAFGATDLAAAVSELETLADDAAMAQGGRMVKLVGDEVMFVAPDAATGCGVALAMLDAATGHPVLPPLRAAVTFGRVVPHDGDYFGLTVNLAARLVDAARAGELLVGDTVAAALDPEHHAMTEVPAVSLKGFTESVRAFAVRRAAARA
jgi:class 3 adenylate cyclase